MTIITKPLSEKKGDKLVITSLEELVDQLETGGRPSAPDDVEAEADSNVVFLQARAKRVANSTTLGLLIAALIVVSIGIIGGTVFYRQYFSPSQTFRGWATIPIRRQENDNVFYEKLVKNPQFLDYELSEELEIDLGNENYEKIRVPDFGNGRSGRFIHDFNTNKTGIIDVSGRRCFVMPLDRENVLPPKNFYDMMNKMWDGYYKVDTEVVRETMRVVVPPLNDDQLKTIGTYINQECKDMPIYKLEKFVGGVVKRSADMKSPVKFVEFSGKGITEIDINNYAEIEKYEQSHR